MKLNPDLFHVSKVKTTFNYLSHCLTGLLVYYDQRSKKIAQKNFIEELKEQHNYAHQNFPPHANITN